MSEALLALVRKSNVGELLTRYMNFTDQPDLPRESAAFRDAWQRTGRHLRKAMIDYGKKQDIVVRVEYKHKK